MDSNSTLNVSSRSVNDERLWATFAHLGGLFFSILAPLIIWLVIKDKSSFVDRHGKEALNFQISLIIYGIISVFLMILLVGFFLIFALYIFEIIFVIKAAVAANHGKDFKYPLAIRFIK